MGRIVFILSLCCLSGVFASSPPSSSDEPTKICAARRAEKLEEGPFTAKLGSGDEFEKVHGTCREGLPEGKWLIRDGDGVKTFEGSYVNGKREGRFVFHLRKKEFSDTEHEYLEENYHEGLLTNFLPEPEQSLKEKKDGYYVFSDEKGRTLRKEQYENGEKIFEWRLRQGFSEEGKFKKGKKSGTWTYKFTNDKLMKKGKFVDGKMDGTWNYYDAKGHLCQTQNYQHGVLQGRETSYYSTGKRKSTGVYSEGKKHGWWLSYNQKGGISYKIRFVHGKIKQRKKFARGIASRDNR